MTFVAVLPSIWPEWTERCLRSCAFGDHINVVDNTETNRGVAASWNLGIDHMGNAHADWLVIMSAALRFGEPGGLDFIAKLERYGPGTIAIEAAHGIGWHLIAFHRDTFERVGTFDENLWPAYHEDVDFSRRCWLTYRQPVEPWWPKVSVDVAVAGFAHGVDLAGVRVDNEQLEGYMKRKWGGEKGAMTFVRPFGTEPLSWWPPEGDPRSIIGEVHP